MLRACVRARVRVRVRVLFCCLFWVLVFVMVDFEGTAVHGAWPDCNLMQGTETKKDGSAVLLWFWGKKRKYEIINVHVLSIGNYL